MGTTDDRSDPRLTRGADEEPVEQAEVYLVLSDAERAKGFVRPYRDSYTHLACGTVTKRDPHFYGATYCVSCRMHRPVGEYGEFVWWPDGSKVGT